MTNSAKRQIEQLLSQAGIKINGPNPWDIQVHNERLYQRVLANGSLGLGESYMDGWWDCKRLDIFFEKILSNKLDKKVKINLKLISTYLKAKVINLQSKSKAFEVGVKHYDLGNDLYSSMLDKTMTYTCGYWKNSKTLDEAQEAKLELVCKKLGLKPGDKVLDIGCGWGSFVKYAAKKYKISAVGITISKKQANYATQLCKNLPIEIKLQDYRDINGQFDHIVSLGMFEHVGYKNYKTYMKIVSKCLKPNGLFLLHTIGGNKSNKTSDPWIMKYIFPNSMLPSIKQIADASEGMLIIEDLHNFGYYYDKTLMSWHSNFNKNWNKIKHNYDERFYRMWNYYLLSCTASFRVRRNQLWQIVFSKNGVKNSYDSIR